MQAIKINASIKWIGIEWNWGILDETSQEVGGITGPTRPPATGQAFLTCWVKAACGDEGDLLGAPRALSGFESQDLSLESGSRGVRARPKPSSVSAMVSPGSCARPRFYSEDDRRESWRVSSDIGDGCLTLHSKLKEASESLFIVTLSNHAPLLAKYPFQTGRRPARPPASPLHRLWVIRELSVKFV